MTRPGRPRGSLSATKIEPLIVSDTVADAQLSVANALLASRAGKSTEVQVHLANAQRRLVAAREALERGK